MGTRRGFLKSVLSAGAGAGALIVGGAPAAADSKELASVKLEIAKLELLKLQMEANPPVLVERILSVFPKDGARYKALPFIDTGPGFQPSFHVFQAGGKLPSPGTRVFFKRPGSLLQQIGIMNGRYRANNREAWLESAFQSLEEDA